MPTSLLVVVVLVGIIVAAILGGLAVGRRDRRAEASRARTYPDAVRHRLESGPGPDGGVDTPPWVAEAEKRRRGARGEDDRTLELVAELSAIGRGRGFLSVHTGKDRRTREIGTELHRKGGKQKMLQAHAAVRAELGQVPARELEAAWDGVGDWWG